MVSRYYLVDGNQTDVMDGSMQEVIILKFDKFEKMLQEYEVGL